VTDNETADEFFSALDKQGKRFIIHPSEITIVRDADTHEVTAYIWEPPATREGE
jgi:hypothetical protein